MNEIKVTVNLAVFIILVIVWLIIGGLKLGGIDIPSDINTIFSMIGGALLVIFNSFKDGVTFSSVTKSISSSSTETTTGEELEPKEDQAA